MKKQINPLDNFLFSIPDKHGKLTFKELKNVKDIKTKQVNVIDIKMNKPLGKMSGLAALLKFS